MQRFLSIALALCVGLTLSLDANAKRFGGGKSSGSAPIHQTRQATPTTPAAAPAAAPGRAAPAASGASRWLGPLAGLAAGGLLASMFMGDGFEGFQIMDFLIVALIAFLVFRFIAARRRQQQPQVAMPGHAPMQREAHNQPAQPSVFGGSAAPAAAAPVINAPAWFNEQSFLAAARNHFQSLQQHWDANEMDKITEFVTPQMLEFLKRERAELGDGFQSTYIDNLEVQLDGIDDRADRTDATLTFRGVSKNSRFDQGEVFSESWHMVRAPGENQPWLVAGIRQNG
ncbi:TPA: TIM44-like domain-containing protein [Pseudomonas putida]|uniref:Tim44 domain-containing protein n=1 Tax=Pseudomonas TaxID=286 RepID=UPI00104343A3|nr:MULTISPECIES: TIM44-like domain-containing protein [Pseudomonas]MCS4063209.1 putative lipid-binding transport protein (Tim44 family) [Pseudomonas putida]MDD1992498.1 TIM44-like domain-containing protein [Pseudomonas putida]TCP73624.1 putative lipid-binding transport protein (Tim44 family) [Pseudomonas putida]HDS0919136.1 TIM44-like domain-containing protein [Pseudomonas putida]HDS0934738.1 TIM44-like domain-containing protein [Pseudomonas putida]